MSLRVGKEMFSQRGYTSIEEVSDRVLRGRQENELVELCLVAEKVNVELIKYYYKYFKDNNVCRGILVYTNSVTPAVNKLISTLDLVIELFHMDQLSFNVTKHVLVPHHVKIDHWDTNDRNYPILLTSDPISRFLGFRVGDVIKITRRDGSLYYRYVSN
jgi:DNA-directed RNA polymerase I, II, and III subunit RPABC1